MLAKDKMWNGSGWYGFIGAISTSTADVSLYLFREELVQILPVLDVVLIFFPFWSFVNMIGFLRKVEYHLSRS